MANSNAVPAEERERQSLALQVIIAAAYGGCGRSGSSGVRYSVLGVGSVGGEG